jgi:hypothetical protein
VTANVKGIRLVRLAVVGLWLVGFPALAPAKTSFDVIGGSGDASATDECPPGQHVVGLMVRSGSWWDQMTIICAEVQPDGMLGPAASYRPPRGGDGGIAPTLYRCRDPEVVTAVTLVMTAHLEQVAGAHLECWSASTWHMVDAPPSFSDDGGSFRQRCPPGEAATGFQVRYGRHVNALGLICDTYEVPIVAATPVPSERAGEPNTGSVDVKLPGGAAGVAQ